MRFLYVCILVLGVLWPSPLLAQTAAIEIQRAEQYLQNLDQAKAEFIQIAHNGSRLSGTFYLNRPGKLRFEYNEIDDFIVADGFFIYFYDAELQEQTNAPIGQTLADFLLRKDLSLQGDITVQHMTQKDGFTILKVAQAGDPGAGHITLYFSNEPSYLLRKWEVTDAAGLTTQIILRNMQTDVDLPNRLFSYFDPAKNQTKPSYNE
ncbi:MAG: outer membrane lipoprotein carrier protein LolA [Alphaproteobacteria bacterium]|nr:outer membrane lipoprotein carrier protein LolA [Alphaproteobacteria bacterium]